MLRRASPLPPPTEEQVAICDFVAGASSNLQVVALAGTGKTTTLEMIVKTLRKQPILCLAFNKRIQVEMEKRFPPTVTTRTFNGCGHRVWAKVCGKVNLDTKKMSELFKQETADLKGDDKREVRDAYFDILSAIGKAKSLGYIPEGKYPHAKRLCSRSQLHVALDEKPSPLIADLIDSLLLRSIKTAYGGWIDFDDQIFMPTLFGGTFPRFPSILVDEGQDLNPTNHEMLGKLVSDWLGVVGDPWQSIYGFRGAVSEGMEKLAERFKCETKGLTVTFRCPRAIVENVHWRVPEYKFVKEGGSVETLQSLDLGQIPDNAAVLCRNNAPLFRLAFGLLARKRSVSLAGSEIGPKLIRILQKIGDPRDNQEALNAKINAWYEEKAQKTNAPKSLADMAACLKIFASFGKTLDVAVAYAEHLFAQQGTIKLSTGHKAKGLEWDDVYILDEWLCDSNEQDLNLRYVMATRSKNNLRYINSDQVQWGTHAN